MPSRSFLDNQPTTPAIKHHSVVVETHDNATTSPLTSSLGGSPARTTGDRTPEYPLARGGAVMSHYPHHHPHHHHHPSQQHPPPPGQQQSQGEPPQAVGQRGDHRYVQMVSAGAPPHFQGHVAYMPPNIPQLYGAPPPQGASSYAAPPPGIYPPQHPGSGQHHQTYVIAGYPPGHGHPQHGPPGSPYFTVNAMPPGSYPPPPPQGYHPHHPHAGGGHPQHPPSPHHPHHARPPPPHHGAQPVYVRHGAPGSSQYPPQVMYAQQPPPSQQHQPPQPVAPRGPPPSSMVSASATTVHSGSVSKASTHPLDKESRESTSGDPSLMKSSHEPMQSMEDMQAEREKEEMAMEQVLKSVKPIQTDYHLFIEEEMKKHKEMAAEDGGDDAYLRNSSLNYRLKAAWENLDQSQRAIFLKREELDRKRFMEEEEIASRHCATLTARNSTPTSRKKSQSTAEVTVDEEEDEEDETRDDPHKRARDKDDPEQDESPIKKERIEEATSNVEEV